MAHILILHFASIQSALTSIEHNFSTWGKIICVIGVIGGCILWALSAGFGNVHGGAIGIKVAGACMICAGLIAGALSLINFGSSIHP